MWLARLRSYARNLVRGRAVERDLDREVESYLEMLADEHQARPGRDGARRAAPRAGAGPAARRRRAGHRRRRRAGALAAHGRAALRRDPDRPAHVRRAHHGAARGRDPGLRPAGAPGLACQRHERAQIGMTGSRVPRFTVPGSARLVLLVWCFLCGASRVVLLVWCFSCGASRVVILVSCLPSCPSCPSCSYSLCLSVPR